MDDAQLRLAWMARNNNVPVSSYIQNIRKSQGDGIEFILIWFKDNVAGDRMTPLDSLRSLNVFSREPIRELFHRIALLELSNSLQEVSIQIHSHYAEGTL